MRINYLDYEKVIVFKAKKSWVPSIDWEDVAQELRIHLWLKQDSYDPHKGASEKTFVNRLLENKIKDLQRTVNRQKRLLDTYHFTFSQLEETEAGMLWLESAIPIFQEGLS